MYIDSYNRISITTTIQFVNDNNRLLVW